MKFRSVSNQQHLPQMFFPTSPIGQSPSGPFKAHFKHPPSLPSPSTKQIISTAIAALYPMDDVIYHTVFYYLLMVCLPHRPWALGERELV